MDFRSAYDGRGDVVSDETGLHCLDESRTVQSQKDDADINVIVRRFGLTGELPVNLKVPVSADYRDVDNFDLGVALRFVNDANRAFMQMPAHVRERFMNDPVRFVAFVENPENVDECVKLGLAVKKDVPAKPGPMEVVVVSGSTEAKPK